jgi:hypothetical protein
VIALAWVRGAWPAALFEVAADGGAGDQVHAKRLAAGHRRQSCDKPPQGCTVGRDGFGIFAVEKVDEGSHDFRVVPGEIIHTAARFGSHGARVDSPTSFWLKLWMEQVETPR